MIEPEWQQKNPYEVKSDETNEGAINFNANGVKVGNFNKDDSDVDLETCSMRQSAVRTNGVGAPFARQQGPTQMILSRKGVQSQTVSDSCKSPGKAGGVSDYRANLPKAGGSAAVRRGETEEPEDDLDEMLINDMNQLELLVKVGRFSVRCPRTL